MTIHHPIYKLRIVNCVAFAVLCGALPARPAAGAEPAPSWTALPDETVLMVRLPGGEAFLDTLRKQTKLGAVVLSQERLERAAKVIQEQSPDDWDEVREELGRVDLKPEDLKGLFHGDLGVALAMEPRQDRLPLLVLLGWLEPGEELAPRLMAAMQSALADEADESFGARRKDIELAGHEVMHVEIPIPGMAIPQLPEVDDDDNSKQKLEEEIEKFKERLKEAKSVESDRVHSFVSRLGGRIVWASTLPQSSSEVQKKNDAEREAIDWDTLTGLEQATAIFGRFLSAHDGASPSGVRRLLETPGMETSLPAGTALLEIVADPRPLLKLADLPSNPKIKQILEALGVESLGPLAFRAALEGGVLRSGAFLSMPAPRPGLLALFDQPKLTPEPPAWVPTSALGYSQVSFDLGRAYTVIKDLVIEQSGGAARQTFDQIETVVKAYLQVDLMEVLSSLGEQHSSVTFAPRFAEANDDASGKSASAVAQRVGIVFNLKNEQVWQQVLQVAGRFAKGGAVGGLQAVEEQGFSGYRVQQQNVEVGIFVGHGYLVVGVGPEVTESLLSVLRSPPEGGAALRNSGLVERGRALIAPQPCWIYQLSDAGASVKVTRQAIQSLLEAPLHMNVAQPAAALAPGFPTFGAQPTAAQKELIEKIKALLPNDDELEGVMGVSIGQTVVTDEGLMIQSALELPAP